MNAFPGNDPGAATTLGNSVLGFPFSGFRAGPVFKIENQALHPTDSAKAGVEELQLDRRFFGGFFQFNETEFPIQGDNSPDTMELQLRKIDTSSGKFPSDSGTDFEIGGLPQNSPPEQPVGLLAETPQKPKGKEEIQHADQRVLHELVQYERNDK